ncbi:MAG: hypothetical protein H6Q18_449 [Bacteroidetes bacterium]|nr:hypothetical protein [Bacteroidota bacterium]
MADIEIIQHKIYEIRGFQVMIDFDLAELYETTTSLLKRAVRRNIRRFPSDFMFTLTKEEANFLVFNRVSQNGTPGYNFSGYAPFAFTEQGVAMLSSVLRSSKAIEVNISIMRAFVQMRQFLLQNRIIFQSIEELKLKIKTIEEASEETLSAINDLSEDTRKEIDDIYIALAEMANKQGQLNKPRNIIGYIKHNET